MEENSITNSPHMSAQPPKRGRPRNYTVTGDFDERLICEYRRRPGLYDRNDPGFKDKINSALLWQDMADQMGYNANILKDHMAHLRNRYSNEKRRLEEMQKAPMGQPVKSSWPLFKQLHFLSEHIRQRRSYKGLLSSQNAQYSTSTESINVTGIPPASEAKYLVKENLSVKMEELEEASQAPFEQYQLNIVPASYTSTSFEVNDVNASTSSAQHPPSMRKQGFPNRDSINTPVNIRAPLQAKAADSTTAIPDSAHLPPKTIFVNGSTEVLPRSSMQKQPVQTNKRVNHTMLLNNSNKVAKMTPEPKRTVMPEAMQEANHFKSGQSARYAAFGTFVSSWLLTLPESYAVQLVKAMTDDILHVMFQTDEELMNAGDPQQN